ncbi:unnamed protein product [Plutella xylostella]|uniref:Mannosyltransferase n=1 Tax=Plutella xylostella TaxID=51655 RepID=A0A8S4DZB7_PLUXY|nr:unnamed protein product [Plutella xylostella]
MPLTARQRTAKNGSKRAPSFNKGKRPRKGSEGDYLVSNASTDLKSLAYPGGAVALLVLVTSRLAAAYFGHVADCDETYNYWEPLHYLVYGSGLQTWEYSPQYAIRSYAPLWLFAVPANFLKSFCTPVVIFYVIRALLAVLTALAEFMFYKAVCHEFGTNVGRLWLALAAPAAGMAASSAALLPSAWSGALAAAALACWWRRRYAPAVVFTAVNVLLSWPFTILLGAPIAIDMLILKRKYTEFIKWSLISLVVILVPTIAIDSWHYGRLVVAPWNIVAYNIFTEHGPDLYGVEPWTYYFVNGFLNFNFVWILALLCPLLLTLSQHVTSSSRPPLSLPYWLSLMPLGAWLVVFMLQPHKEERFLYPVYSLIPLAAAISLDALWRATQAVLRARRHSPPPAAPLARVFILAVAVASISRSISLYNNYHGPMSLLRSLPPTESATVCLGKDWYRSPSSFHLPEDCEVRFVKSEFSGQMPAPYDVGSNATRMVHPYFNDLNKEDTRTYIPPEKCHYLIDSDIGDPTPLQPDYHSDTQRWEVVNSVPILDAAKSDPLLRAFYVPFLSSRTNVYANLYLLRNKLLNA